MTPNDIEHKTYDVHAFELHSQLDPHHHTSKISDVILGGQDGLVNVLGVVMGVAAATSEPRIVLAAGMVAAFAESVSMAAVAYTSTQADYALYKSELAREHRHVRLVPTLERDEIREIYRKKGFDGALLNQVVEAITADKDVWVALMMAEELKLSPVGKHDALKSSLVVGASALIGSLVPLAPFAMIPILPALLASILFTGATLFFIGAYKAHLTVGHWSRSGIEMTIIGIGSALVGYAVGLLFKVPTP